MTTVLHSPSRRSTARLQEASLLEGPMLLLRSIRGFSSHRSLMWLACVPCVCVACGSARGTRTCHWVVSGVRTATILVWPARTPTGKPSSLGRLVPTKNRTRRRKKKSNRPRPLDGNVVAAPSRYGRLGAVPKVPKVPQAHRRPHHWHPPRCRPATGMTCKATTTTTVAATTTASAPPATTAPSAHPRARS